MAQLTPEEFLDTVLVPEKQYGMKFEIEYFKVNVAIVGNHQVNFKLNI